MRTQPSADGKQAGEVHPGQEKLEAAQLAALQPTNSNPQREAMQQPLSARGVAPLGGGGMSSRGDGGLSSPAAREGAAAPAAAARPRAIMQVCDYLTQHVNQVCFTDGTH